MSRFQEGREEYVERQEKYKVITKVSRPENPVHAFAEHPNPLPSYEGNSENNECQCFAISCFIMGEVALGPSKYNAILNLGNLHLSYKK